jgi:hypothetical protein
MIPKKREIQKRVVKPKASVPQKPKASVPQKPKASALQKSQSIESIAHQPQPIELTPQNPQLTPVDWSRLIELADAANIILQNKPAADGLMLLALYNKVQIKNTPHGPQINIEGIQITQIKGVLIAHFHEGCHNGYLMGSKFPMLWLKELQQLRRDIIKHQF